MSGKMNQTGLQPVSRPVEQIIHFFTKGLINYQKRDPYQGV